MNRRRFVAGCLTAVGIDLLSGCWTLPSQARPPARIPRVGYLENDSEANYPVERLETFRAGLRELGYVEGQPITIDVRFARSAGPGRTAEILAEMVREPADVIVMRGGNAVRLARQVTDTTPIVMVYAGDPVGLGLVASLARPASNVTGFTLLEPELAPKRLQLLEETAPSVSRIGVLYNADDPSMELTFQAARAAGPRLGVAVHALGVLRDELAGPLAAALDARVDALLVIDSGTGRQREPILDFAARHQLPRMEWPDRLGDRGWTDGLRRGSIGPVPSGRDVGG